MFENKVLKRLDMYVDVLFVRARRPRPRSGLGYATRKDELSRNKYPYPSASSLLQLARSNMHSTSLTLAKTFKDLH